MKLQVLLVALAAASVAVGQEIRKARLDTCGGWRLNSLPKVKGFINDHLPLYPDVTIKYVGGADPQMVLLTEDSEEVQRVPVATLSEQEIMDLLSSHGIEKQPVEQAQEENAESHEREDL